MLDYHLLISHSCPYVFMDMHGKGFAGASGVTCNNIPGLLRMQ